MPQIHETRMGQLMIDAIPKIARATQDIAKELKRFNDLREKEQIQHKDTPTMIKEFPTKKEGELR